MILQSKKIKKIVLSTCLLGFEIFNAILSENSGIKVEKKVLNLHLQRYHCYCKPA